MAKDAPQDYEPKLAILYNDLGKLYSEIKCFDESEVMYKKSLSIYDYLAKENPQVYESDLAETYFNLAHSYNKVRRLSESEGMYKAALLIYKRLEKDDSEEIQSALNSIYTNMSFNSNLLGKFKDGELYALEALKVDSTKHLAYTNLAAALLFQGKTVEAEKLYRQFKSEFKDGFLDDFAEYERLGVIPEERKMDVERIKAMLKAE